MTPHFLPRRNVWAGVLAKTLPAAFDPAAPMDAERQRICSLLMDRIRTMAEALPRHRVVPYRPQPKKNWPYNRPKEATAR